MAETLDVGIVFGFNHDAGELLRAGIAKNDAAIFAESGLRFGKRAGNLGESFERGLGFYFYVDDDLRIVLQAFDERFDFAVHGDERGDFYGSEQAIAGGAVFQKNDVAGLFAADDVAAAKHFFKNVAVADGGAGKRDAFASQNAFEAEIRHGGGDDAITLELVLGFEVTSDGEENAVTIDDFPRFTDEEGAIGIAVKGDAELGAFRDDALLQAFEMKRTTACIDIAAVGRDAHRDDVRAKRAEELRAEFVCGAIRAIQNDSKAGKPCALKDAAAEEIEIFGVEGFIGWKQGRILGRRAGAMLEDIGFEFFLDGIREFHAGVREKFYAIVVIGIVRSGNDDAGVKIVLADEASYTWSRDNTGESDRGASLLEASGKQSGDVGTGFTRVHADENVSSGMFAQQVSGEGATCGEESGVVKRGSAGNAANTVGAEEFFGHERLSSVANGLRLEKFSTGPKGRRERAVRECARDNAELLDGEFRMEHRPKRFDIRNASERRRHEFARVC